MDAMQIIYPEYDRCSLNLLSSIGQFFGLRPAFPPLEELQALIQPTHQNIILLVLDGLGSYSLMELLGEDSFLSRHKLCDLSAVFPSTTVAATTSLRTGLPPAQHGWLGWTMFFPELSQSVDVFQNQVQFTGDQVAPYHAGRRFLPTFEISQQITDRRLAKGYAVSAHDALFARDWDQLSNVLLDVCREPGQKYVYAYYNQPDAEMHDTGVGSLQTKLVVKTLDRQVKRLADSLPMNTLLLITADHGLLDTRPVYVSDHKVLKEALIRPPVLEPRAAALYVKPEMLGAFPAIFDQAFGHDFYLMKSQKAVERGLFGPAPHRADLLSYLGDYLALAVGDKALYNHRGQKTLVGMHAGLTRREMVVPLVVAKS